MTHLLWTQRDGTCIIASNEHTAHKMNPTSRLLPELQSKEMVYLKLVVLKHVALKQQFGEAMSNGKQYWRPIQQGLIHGGRGKEKSVTPAWNS